MEHHRVSIYCLCLLQHRKIIDGAGISQCIVGKSHIFCCQHLPICKFHIITNIYSPGQPILAGLHGFSQIIIDLQI